MHLPLEHVKWFEQEERQGVRVSVNHDAVNQNKALHPFLPTFKT